MQESNKSSMLPFLSKAVDLVLLNVLFFVSCLPIVTIGAASTALYAVAFTLDEPREEGLLRRFFRAFREGWKQSTAVFLILAAFAGASLVNIQRCLEMGGILGYALFAMSLILLLVCGSVYSYAFPLISRFRNTLTHTLLNSLLLSLGSLPRTALLLTGNFFPLLVMDVNLYTFLRIASVWMLIYFAAAAWFHTKVLKTVMDHLTESAAAP